jgi:L-fucose mutarotase
LFAQIVQDGPTIAATNGNNEVEIMLKGIPSILPPELVKVLMEMGHGDEICLGDANFPHTSLNGRVIRCDGHGVPDLLEAILSLMPLDTYCDKPVSLMAVNPADALTVPIWDTYRDLVCRYDDRCGELIQFIERFDFYDRARQCFAVVATGEKALYANIILKKGVITD